MRPALCELPPPSTQLSRVSRCSSKEGASIAIMGGRCIGCSSVVPNSLFDFHHWDPREKGFGISRDGMARRWEVIAAELLKCAMLCANCHRELHRGVRELERQSSVTVRAEPARRWPRNLVAP
jgi:hypothetical protein